MNANEYINNKNNNINNNKHDDLNHKRTRK